MALTTSALQALTQGSDADAWRVIVGHAVEIASKPLAAGNAPSEVVKRDREIGALICSLLQRLGFVASLRRQRRTHLGSLGALVGRALQRQGGIDPRRPFPARATVAVAGREGARLHHARGRCLRLRTARRNRRFARALGFSSRSRLQNNGGGLAHKLQAANTETMDLPWRDCEALIGSAPNQIFWHHWPDAKLHDIAGQGQGWNR